ncbi:MAG: hypothetical protein JZU67_05295, partial [Burkholderiaceae bacterium]|nr:hypothetical protein [Burkholderiaceae bacterium]
SIGSTKLIISPLCSCTYLASGIILLINSWYVCSKAVIVPISAGSGSDQCERDNGMDKSSCD